MKDLNLYNIALIIVIVGGINWGIVGLIRLDLITAIFGFNLFSRLIFLIIGVAAGYLIYLLYIGKSKQQTPPPPAA